MTKNNKITQIKKIDKPNKINIQYHEILKMINNYEKKTKENEKLWKYI